MRIISGSARGRRLKAPECGGVRPTSDKVKESIFNIIQFDIEGRRVLDLFAGSGQLGIEALSRGAQSACFVDINQSCIKTIRDNLKSCGFENKAQVICADAAGYLRRGGGKNTQTESFDIIFIDPPYDTQLANQAVCAITGFDKLRVNGIIICETSSAAALMQIEHPHILAKTYKYGQTALLKIVRQPDEVT